LIYRGWHGKYRALDDHRVRVIDGQRDDPSLVFAQDIFEILDERPTAHEVAVLQARFAGCLMRGEDGEARRGIAVHRRCLHALRSQPHG
jgi:hypothetical protein